MDERERLTEALADLYRIDREIGRGGMATVYLAQDPKHDREVAVKVLDSELTKTVGAERFLHEIKIAAKLTHPHILPVFDSGQVDEFLFFVMPFVSGECLRTRIERDKQLPLEEAIRITRQVADALAHAHSRGTLHRDVKPGNILLEAGHAILADFGVARALATDKGERLTKTGLSVGTATYMSPEQASGELNLDGRSDQYSLACVLYEMLTGAPPFRGPAEESVARQHMTADPVPVTQIRPSVPPGIALALSQALAKTPADRFTSISDFGRALGRRAEGGWGAVAPREVRKKPGFGGLIAALSSRAKSRGGGALAAVGAVGLALVLVFTRPWDGQLTPLTVLAERSFQDSVAVVPFETHAPDEDLSTLAGFLTDNITRELKRSDFVRVTPLFSVKQLLKLPLTDAQLADSLEVGRLLVGSLTGVEDSLVLGIDILDFTGDGAGTSLEYRSQLPVTSENAVLLAEGVARDYLSQFSEATLRLAHGPSPFGPGYERLMEGSDALSGRTPSDLARAREAFKEVLDLDPENAHAFAGLSKYYTLADVYRYRTDVERYETAGLAYAHAQRAIALAPNLADGYTARGLIARRSFAPLSDVEADCRQAWEIEPGNAEGLAWCAQTLRLRGADDDGFQLAEQAIRMDPQNAGRRMSLAWIALSIGDYETARQQAHEASRLANEMVLARAVEAYALLLGGAWETCADLDLGPHSVLRATCLHEMGRSEEAEALVDSVKVALEAGTIDDEVFTEVVRTADLAVYYARLGDPSESLRWVTESYERSPSGIDERALQSALFDRVREDPEFSRGLERARAKVWDRVRVAAERAYEDRFGDSGLP